MQSPWFFPELFCAAAALSVLLLAAGSTLTLWVQYITRTGKPPLRLIGVDAIRSAFRRQEEDEPVAPPATKNRTGP